MCAEKPPGRRKRGTDQITVRLPDGPPVLTPKAARVLLHIIVELSDERKWQQTSGTTQNPTWSTEDGPDDIAGYEIQDHGSAVGAPQLSHASPQPDRDTTTDLTASTLFSDAAHQWLDQFRADAENGIYSWASVDTYTDHLRNHVLPAVGGLRLVEVTTPVINRLCQQKLKNYSLSLAKHTKAIVSNVMTFAVQAGAIDRNPTKEIDKLTERRARTKKKVARALTADHVLDLLGKLDSDEEAARRDLPDLVRFFLATGERLGEVLGAHWSDVDLTAETLTMTGNIIQARGKGVVRNAGKSDTSRRTIALSDWCVEMLRERKSKLGIIDLDTPIFSNVRGGYLSASNLSNRHWLPFRTRAGYGWVTFTRSERRWRPCLTRPA